VHAGALWEHAAVVAEDPVDAERRSGMRVAMSGAMQIDKVLVGTVSALTIAALAFTWSATAQAPQQQGVTLRSLGKCLDVDHALTANGTRVQLWQCHGGANQRWIFENGAIRSAIAPNLCLDVDHASASPGTRIQIWQCHGGANQRWIMENGTIRSAIPGNVCLDVFEAANANGTNVVSWNCHGNTNQQWSIQ
jgi:hypothetical protein